MQIQQGATPTHPTYSDKKKGERRIDKDPNKQADRDREREHTHHFVNDANHQTTTRTNGDIRLLVPEVHQRDLEPVAARTRIVVDLQRLVERHVLDLDLVVD